jgi:hypothetical protein
MSRNAITLQSKAERERAAAWCMNAPTGTSVEFRGPRRNCDQNALMWSLLGQISEASEVARSATVIGGLQGPLQRFAPSLPDSAGH